MGAILESIRRIRLEIIGSLEVILECILEISRESIINVIGLIIGNIYCRLGVVLVGVIVCGHL